jgi:hypothetical protein
MEGKEETGYRTLQKSILLTPLLPSAGPTGGDGEAWPAPTISLTITSFCNALLAIVEVYDEEDLFRLIFR